MNFPELVDKTQNYYTILNCHRTSSAMQIKTEYKLLALQYHPDKDKEPSSSKSSALSQKFQDIEKAKKVLLNEEMRAKYDKWLDSGIAVSFEVWLERFADRHMHWSGSAETTLSVTQEDTSPSSSLSWERHSDPTIELFRKGKI